MNRALILTLVLAGCGGDGEPTDEPIAAEPTAGTEDPAPAVAAGELTWPEMDREQRLAYMQQTVMPEMKALFVAFDAERYADFGCATCHGEDMQAVDFAMPNGLAPLVPSEIPAMFQSEQPMAVFMTQEAWPKMVELLDAQPYDPETHEGFGCLGCHATAEGG